MKNRTPRPAPPRLTEGQLRQLIAAEQAGVKGPCLLCEQPVLDQTFKPSYADGADEKDRMLINSPCGHAMTYGAGLAEQMEAQMRMEEATEATEPQTTAFPGVMDAVASALEEYGVWVPEDARKAVAEAVLAAVAAGGRQ